MISDPGALPRQAAHDEIEGFETAYQEVDTPTAPQHAMGWLNHKRVLIEWNGQWLL